jgi:AmiR/NasT family two-component response regulator
VRSVEGAVVPESAEPNWFVDLLGAYPTVHQATGIMSVQMGCTVEEAALRLRAEADTSQRPVEAIAADVLAKKVRFD